MTKRKTLIIGGTGNIGQSLVELMQKSGEDFIVMARSPEKAKRLQDQGIPTMIGELGDWTNLKNKLAGIDTVFLLTNPSSDQVTLQNGLIDLAINQGVRKIVKISVIGAATGSTIHLADWHGQTEKYLRSSGLQYVILQPHSFMQNILMSQPSIKEQGVFYQSLGDAKIPLVDIRDVAKASYQAIVSDDYNNHTYVITGALPISFGEVATALSEAMGKPINYVPIPVEAHRSGMKEAGLPEWLADDLANMNAFHLQAPEQPASGDFEYLTQAKQVSIMDFAKDYADYFK